MNIDSYNKSFVNKEYIKGRGKQTEYYILTAKYGKHNYRLTLLRNHLIVMEGYYEGLTMAKYGAFEWLLNHDSTIFEMNKATMVHYKEDRPNGEAWVKDTNIELHKNLKSFFNNWKGKSNSFTQVNVAVTQETREEKNEESGMIIPALEPVTRSREYNLYDDSIRDRAVYEYLFNSESHRWIDEHVIGLNKNESRGYQAMGILHFLGLKNVHKGIFSGKSIDEAIIILEEQESDFSLVIQCLYRLIRQTMKSRNLEEVIVNDIESEKAEDDTYYKEGAVKQYYGKRFERKPENRKRAIEIHGLSCVVCGFNFEEVYGERGKDFIEVHHVNPLSTICEEVVIDPKNDLVSVCANCHRMIHRRKNEVLNVEDLRTLVKAK